MYYKHCTHVFVQYKVRLLLSTKCESQSELNHVPNGYH